MSSIVSPMRQISPRRATRSTTKSASALARRRRHGGLGGARGRLGAADDVDGGADLAPLALVEHARDHLPEVGLGLVVLAALAAHPDLVDDAPAAQRRQRHRGAARRDAEARLDLRLGQRLARQVEQAEGAPHRAREAPELGDAAAGVGGRARAACVELVGGAHARGRRSGTSSRAASWPQAASMSSPRGDADVDGDARRRAGAPGTSGCARRTGARTSGPRNGFQGMRFTLAGMPRSSRGRRSASASLSLTPASSTYSNVTRRPCDEREPARGVEQRGDRPLLVDRHDPRRAPRRWWRSARSPGWARASSAPSFSIAGHQARRRHGDPPRREARRPTGARAARARA